MAAGLYHPRCRHGCGTYYPEVADIWDRDDKNENTNLPETSLNNKYDGGIINKQISGAVSGALNPYSKRADEHAIRMYEEIRKRKTDIEAISKHTSYSIEEITKIKNYLFIDEHNLSSGVKRFDASFDIAQSWDRLTKGVAEPHDLLLLQHEIYERQLVMSGISQNEAHIMASKKYNYLKGATEYNAKIKANKK